MTVISVVKKPKDELQKLVDQIPISEFVDMIKKLEKEIDGLCLKLGIQHTLSHNDDSIMIRKEIERIEEETKKHRELLLFLIAGLKTVKENFENDLAERGRRRRGENA